MAVRNDLITWKNYPERSTPISAENLNLMNTSIMNAQETGLLTTEISQGDSNFQDTGNEQSVESSSGGMVSIDYASMTVKNGYTYIRDNSNKITRYTGEFGDLALVDTGTLPDSVNVADTVWGGFDVSEDGNTILVVVRDELDLGETSEHYIMKVTMTDGDLSTITYDSESTTLGLSGTTSKALRINPDETKIFLTVGTTSTTKFSEYALTGYDLATLTYTADLGDGTSGVIDGNIVVDDDTYWTLSDSWDLSSATSVDISGGYGLVHYDKTNFKAYHCNIFNINNSIIESILTLLPIEDFKGATYGDGGALTKSQNADGVIRYNDDYTIDLITHGIYNEENHGFPLGSKLYFQPNVDSETTVRQFLASGTVYQNATGICYTPNRDLLSVKSETVYRQALYDNGRHVSVQNFTDSKSLELAGTAVLRGVIAFEDGVYFLVDNGSSPDMRSLQYWTWENEDINTLAKEWIISLDTLLGLSDSQPQGLGWNEEHKCVYIKQGGTIVHTIDYTDRKDDSTFTYSGVIAFITSANDIDCLRIGKYLFANSAGTIRRYNINDGVIDDVPTTISPTLGGFGQDSIGFTPDGKYLFCSADNNSTIHKLGSLGDGTIAPYKSDYPCGVVIDENNILIQIK